MLFSEDDDKNGQFNCCVYEYCDNIVHGPELIDNLYCSLLCKKLDSKDVATEKPIKKPMEILKPSKTPTIDRKELLAKLGNRIHKRKQSLTSSNSEKKLRNDDWDEFEQSENSRTELQSDENQSSLNSVVEINSPEAENDGNSNDDDDDEDENSCSLDFKVYLY